MRKISELADYEPRYDPTVIPTMGGSRTNKGNGEADDRLAYVESDDEALYTSIGDVHFAYSIGKTTPSKVIETLLALVDKEPLYKSAFLSIKRMEVIAAAKASTERFQLSQSKSILDGIPIAVKGEEPLRSNLGLYFAQSSIRPLLSLASSSQNIPLPISNSEIAVNCGR